MIDTTTTQAELALLPDHALYPHVPRNRLAELPGLETEVSLRLWCRERGIQRRDLQPMLDGERKPKAAKRHAKQDSAYAASPTAGANEGNRSEE